MSATDFRAVSYPLRLYSGRDALENLPAELKRQGAKRAFVVCGRTVSRKTDLVARIRRIADSAFGGVFDEMEKESPIHAVQAAAQAARAAEADLLIAIGAGSVVQATRVVAILLAEPGPVESLITQYPETGPAISPRLMARKLPIINVLTAATSAQNRAGSAVKNDALDHRMEFFDPKTRPVAVFWDAEALLTAPPRLALHTGVSVYWRAVMDLGAARMAPLSEGDRLQAFRLARNALPRLQDHTAAAPRIELCAAAFLQNRDADDGGGVGKKHWPARVTYAFATALFNLHETVSQAEANTAFAPTVMRRLGNRDPEPMAAIARALGVQQEEASRPDPHLVVADELERHFKSLGMPVRLSELDIGRARMDAVMAHALKNFNADPRREFVRERDFLRAVLDAAW